MKSFKEFCAEAYYINEMAMNPKSRFVTSVQRRDYAANQIGSKEFSDRGGYAALKSGGGQAALRAGSSVNDVLHAGKRATQQKEGPYISPETKARTNLMNAQAEKLRREPTAKKPMDDFAAGGGEAKMKKTGMTRDQVIAQGKKNLTNQK
jgi:hypothetical protein